MSAQSDAADGSGVDVDGIAAELYGMDPDDFIAARDAQVQRARDGGDRALAEAIGMLRRPTRSAWLVNRLRRDQADVVSELLGLADEFTAALADKDGQRLKALTGRRRDLQNELAQRAEWLAREAGTTASADMLREVHETLDAAVSSPEIAEEVRTGRLVKATKASGFGVPTARQADGKRAGSTGKTAPSKASRPVRSASAKDAERRAAAEDAVAAARAALDAASADAADRQQVAEEAERTYVELSEELERVRERARELDKQVAVALQESARAGRRRSQAEAARDRAQATLARAEQTLDSLPAPHSE